MFTPNRDTGYRFKLEGDIMENIKEVEIMDKDFLGNIIEVGDKVIYIRRGYRELGIGIVTAITRTKFRVNGYLMNKESVVKNMRGYYEEN